jgi:hypothetical protein
MHYDLGRGGRGWSKVSWARLDMGADAYLCCPGPSLQPIQRGRGRKVFAINTAYPRVYPDIWMGLDRVECYDRQIWGEPFIKVCRGNYGDMEVDGRPIKYFDNVFFASIAKLEGSMFDYINHEDPLVWHKNTLATMLHLIIKMGAKTIHLAGCDMGGNDYYDERVLSDKHRAINHKLYKEQIEFIRDISKRIKIISVTPNSPLNEFLEYKELDQALKESEEKVKVNDGPILHCLDAEEKYLNKSEKKLYKTLWDIGNYKSQCAAPFVDFIKERVNKTDRILEIGSGDGTTMFGLRELGYDITGTDIYSTHKDIIECSVWKLPFKDNEFDVVISTDVLEHLPTDMVDKSISELQRVAKRHIHIVACWADRQRVKGEVVHKTVRPISWWKGKFNNQEIIDRDDFMREIKNGNTHTV